MQNFMDIYTSKNPSYIDLGCQRMSSNPTKKKFPKSMHKLCIGHHKFSFQIWSQFIFQNMNKPIKFFGIQEYFKIVTAEISNVTLNTQKSY